MVNPDDKNNHSDALNHNQNYDLNATDEQYVAPTPE
jgi:hypothetical protein